MAGQSYIVQATSTSLAAQLVEKHGGAISTQLAIINAVAATLSTEGVAQLKQEHGIVAITPNGSVKSGDDGTGNDKNNNKNKDIPSTDFPEVVGADLVWAEGVNGSGVTVAVLDTGLGNLPALTEALDGKKGRILAWKDFIDDSHKPIDPNGHGSHVAGIIANTQKGADGAWNGIAPGVNLVAGRVLNEEGAGTYETVIAGLQWVLENKDRYNIRVVNLSLLSPAQSPYWADPLDEAVTKVWASGIVVIAAAGNDGPTPMSISVPGNNPYVVTVGAFTDNYTPGDWSDDYIAPFSASGPTLDGFVKPDIVAPGGHIVSVVPKKSLLTDEYPANLLYSNYFKLAGTSQATANVSGIAALIIANNPELTPDQVKARLLSTALPWVDTDTTDALYSMWEQGAGRVNAVDAVFTDSTDSANQGMDIQADLAGTLHYEGYSYYDEETNSFRLYEPFNNWDGGYGIWIWDSARGSWSGARGSWSGARGSWSGASYGSWASARGSWSGARGSWSGDYGTWIGARGSWSGSRGSWSGSRGSWSGSRGSWSGSRGSWSGGYITWGGSRGSWSGSRGSWSGTRGSWSGTEPWAGSMLADPAFVESFSAGVSPDACTTIATVSYFFQDP
jgi:serine protease AprX